MPSHLGSKDPNDPSPWLALYLDRSTPLPDEVKKQWLQDSSSRSRQYLLPFIRPIARALIILVQIIKVVVPKRWAAPRTLHWILATGLKYFVSPEANWLILRHFHIGSRILEFIAANSGVEVECSPLTPKTLDDLKDNLFVKHDLNLFNFVINLNEALREQGKQLESSQSLDFSMISEASFEIDELPNRWCNFIDIQTAIEMFTPTYQLFLTDNDFWRATNSLQLDETIAIYAATLLDDPEIVLLVNNRHPLIPLSTLRAGSRLVIHGMASEMLYSRLLSKKQAANSTGNA